MGQDLNKAQERSFPIHSDSSEQKHECFILLLFNERKWGQMV